MRHSFQPAWLSCVALSLFATLSCAQLQPAGRDARLGPMLDNGLATYETPDFTLRLVNSSGTVADLEPRTRPWSFR